MPRMRRSAPVWASPFRDGAAPNHPLTDLGRPAGRAYAARSGQSEEAYVQQMRKPLTPEIAGSALVELVQADSSRSRSRTC
jgi:hypothetical protein